MVTLQLQSMYSFYHIQPYVITGYANGEVKIAYEEKENVKSLLTRKNI